MNRLEATDRLAAMLSNGPLRFEPLARWFEQHPTLGAIIGLALLVLLALSMQLLVRNWLLRLVSVFARRSSSSWDDVLLEEKVFHRLVVAIPWLLIHQLVTLVPGVPAGLTDAMQRISLAALAIVTVRAIGALLSAVNVIYSRYPLAKHRPIKGYLQVVHILAWIFATVLVVAALVDRSPWLLLSGLGALTAVLMVVFKDTLLSLVAGVQLTTNDLIRVGDWIEMPQFAADGDVVDIGLHAVKVSNWDRTITVIPTHKFLEHSFKNWRGMQEAGGRRIKRSFNVDTSTIRFLDEAEMERFGRFALLRDYMKGKRDELETHNRALQVEPGVIANSRRLTNLGTLRAYIMAYLRQHPLVHQEMTLLVRHLAPTPEGLPIEIYVFSKDIRWAYYEALQADIFDHILAVVPQFGLRVFQNPSGADFGGLARGAPAQLNELRTLPEDKIFDTPAAPAANRPAPEKA